MAVLMQSAVTLLLLLLPSSLVCSATLAAAEAGDEAALLAFKAAAVPGGNSDALASWNRSAGGKFCSWEGVRCGSRHRRVVALSLRSHGLAGVLSPAIGNLSFLRTLDLSANGFSGDIPASLGRLHRLQVLNLSNNAFSSEFPANLSSCTSLMVMALNSNQLRGHIPSELGDKVTHLKGLILWGNNLTGTIPASLGNLSSLLNLDLSVNQLKGTIPPGLGTISGLKYITLFRNQLSGVIPASLGNLPSLNDLELSYNQLEGTIPPSLGDILGIQFLDLGFNNLHGEPPLSLYNLSSLQRLQLQGNMLQGGIPVNIGSKFPSMQILCLYLNQFTRSIPNSISNLTTLRIVDLSQNRLSGHVPRNLGRLQSLQRLYLNQNKLEANNDGEGWEFITSLSNCSQLQLLALSGNDFTGQLPRSIGNLSTTLEYLHFEDTGISGSIPSTIGNLVGLQFLNAANNIISGVVPESIGQLGDLVELFLYNTHLSGLIPSSVGNLSKLNVLYAYHGKLEGAIPASLGKLTNLAGLDLSYNHLNGSIPIEMFNLTFLSSVLNLSYNSLSGSLPSEIGSLRNLNSMVLSGNQLSGEIPDSIGACAVLQQLQLDNNSFTGRIPQSLQNIKGLSALNLSMNKLFGTIPSGIGNIKALQVLYLAHNNLSGPIPAVLENLISLSELDLSFNNLQGEVPKEGIFRNMAKFSIDGNSELCGGIPQLHLAQCQKNSVKRNRTRHLKSLTIALAIVGAVLFLLAFIAALFQLVDTFRKRQNPLLSQIIEKRYGRVSYQALANGTNGFSQANLLGKGSFGAVYQCNFQDEGTVVAVKVFNIEQSGSTRSFVAECEALRRVRHRCLVKIVTCCSSINHQGQEFKALVFEFMPNGSLNNWLHPESNIPTLSNTLSLAQRLDISVDITDALDYLHNHCQPPVVHCDIKPNNILLAEDLSARVGDFGISRFVPESASEALKISNSTTGIRGTVGYVAPEYGEGSSISTLGDVYSLGILLLEMFTGRSPTDGMFGGSLDLHRFSENALPGRIWEIADETMWLHTDAHDNTTRSTIEKCLVSVIALGISCSKKQPRDRILIQDATTEMHAIRDSYLMFD